MTARDAAGSSSSPAPPAASAGPPRWPAPAAGRRLVLAARLGERVWRRPQRSAGRAGPTTLVVPTDVRRRGGRRRRCSGGRRPRFGRVDARGARGGRGRLRAVRGRARRGLRPGARDHAARDRATSPARRCAAFREQGGGTLVRRRLAARQDRHAVHEPLRRRPSGRVQGLVRMLQIEARRRRGSTSAWSRPAASTPRSTARPRTTGPRRPAAAAGRPAGEGGPGRSCGACDGPGRGRLGRRRQPRGGPRVPSAAGVFDRLVGPLMRLGGLSRERLDAHDGNVFVPRPAGEAMHGRWGRHWLRPAGGAAVAAAALGTTALARGSRRAAPRWPERLGGGR